MASVLQFQRGDVLEANRTDVEIGVFKGHRYLVGVLYDRSYGMRGIEPVGGNPGQWFANEHKDVVESGLYSKIAHVDLGDRQIRPDEVDDLLKVVPELKDYVSASK